MGMVNISFGNIKLPVILRIRGKLIVQKHEIIIIWRSLIKAMENFI